MKSNQILAGIFLPLILISNAAFGQAKMKIFFNHPVNTSLSSGVNAVCLPCGSSSTVADTIVAYINAAQHSVDIAQYDYTQDNHYGAYANIATAANNAYGRGVTVRWICDGSSPNSGLSGLSSHINVVHSPTTSAYGIMHNKFIVIDNGYPGLANVITGSADWSSEMFYEDYNNFVFIQDSALAYAYTAEFNMMWGSTTATPNPSAAEFGPYKTDLGLHNFTIGGHQVNLYFSPSDSTDDHIASTILTAHHALYVGMYDMTRTDDANNIVTCKTDSGAYTIAVCDQYTPSTSSSVNSILSSGLGSNYVVYTNPNYIYHNKMMVIDPTDTCDDPKVLTGSQNWTSSANEYNDENFIIIHSDTVANMYYQSIIEDFTTIGGGSFARITGCSPVSPALSAPQVTKAESTATIYPNPAARQFILSYTLPASGNGNIVIYNIIGQKVAVPVNNELQSAGAHTYQVSISEPGVYFVDFTLGSERFTKRVVITE